jgi:iron complex outermembrane receptor protein
VIEPDSHFSVSMDYYYIRIKDVIEPANDTTAINDYYAGLPLPAGFKVTPAGVDPNYPTAQPTIGYLIEGYQNASAQVSTGYDFGATAHYRLPYGVNYTSTFSGTYVLRLETLYPGQSESFAGTIGPYFDVSASGTPKFRANWENTLSYGPLTVGATINFTQGYDLEAEDYGDTAGLCVQNGASASSINAVYQDGVTPVRCKVAAFWDTDTYTTYKITPHIQLFLNVLNVFNTQAPYDPTTYGGYNYNPAWANAGIYGRTFKFGAKAVF